MNMEPKVVSLTSCIYPFDPYLVVDINIIDFSSGARWAVIQTTAALLDSTADNPWAACPDTCTRTQVGSQQGPSPAELESAER